MSETRAIQKPIPAPNLTLATFCVSLLSNKSTFYVDPNQVVLGEQYLLSPSFDDAQQQPKTRAMLTSWRIINSLQARAQWQTPLAITNSPSLISYYRRWKQEIYSRFQEARKRFPEFFPCFELKFNPEGLEYSIHFKPLTKHAEDLTCHAPLFPIHKKFKPIEQLWSEDGQSELDIIFKRFPTQLTLKPHKEQWGTQLWKLIVELIKQEKRLNQHSNKF